MVNSNPETVSTDFDTSDRLYFEPLDEEASATCSRTRGIEDTPAVVPVRRPDRDQPGRAARDAAASDLGSRRRRDRPGRGPRAVRRLPGPTSAFRSRPGGAVTTRRGGARRRRPDRLPGAGPALLRPRRPRDGDRPQRDRADPLHDDAAEVSQRRPILVDKYLEGKEVEVDAICDGDDVLIPGVMEHIERAGVHSGDSMAVYPGQNLAPSGRSTRSSTTRSRSARGSGVRGLMNIQYVLYDEAASTCSRSIRAPAAPCRSSPR